MEFWTSKSRAILLAGALAGPLLAGAALAQAPGPVREPLTYPIEMPPGADPVLGPPIGPRAPDQRAVISPGRPAQPSEQVDPTKLSIYYAEADRPNIGGFWRRTVDRWVFYSEGKALPVMGTVQNQFGFPYRPEWQKVLTDRYNSENINKAYGDPSGGCWLQGMMHSYVGNNSPLEITQTPGLVRIVQERMTPVRRIYTNGELHPADFKPTSQGHSIGHWEDDTLVVDTIGVRPEFTLGYQAPHSSKVHFIERIRRLDATTLAVSISIEDPIAMTSLIQTVLYYTLGPPKDQFAEDFCVENNRNEPDENLIVQANTEPRKLYGFDLPPGASHYDDE